MGNVTPEFSKYHSLVGNTPRLNSQLYETEQSAISCFTAIENAFTSPLFFFFCPQVFLRYGNLGDGVRSISRHVYVVGPIKPVQFFEAELARTFQQY